jgi:hypothetical protein
MFYNVSQLTDILNVGVSDAEYYSVHALKSELKKTPPSKETEQSILYKTLNERINQLEIAISRNRIHITMQSSEITITDFVFIVILNII